MLSPFLLKVLVLCKIAPSSSCVSLVVLILFMLLRNLFGPLFQENNRKMFLSLPFLALPLLRRCSFPFAIGRSLSLIRFLFFLRLLSSLLLLVFLLFLPFRRDLLTEGTEVLFVLRHAEDPV